MEQVSLRALLEAGCHFGHKAERWHPKAASYIFQKRDGIHIIDLFKTKACLEQAAKFIQNLAEEGKSVLFCGTKRQASAVISEEAGKVGAAYFSKRWMGGFLTNWDEIFKNIAKVLRLQSEEKQGAWNKFPKHERVKLERYLRRLEHFYGGVIGLTEPPAALIIVDIKREKAAVREALRIDIPTIAIVDTNSDPTQVTYPIPANDDAVGSIKYIIQHLAQSYSEGRKFFEKKVQTDTQTVQEVKKTAVKTMETPAIKALTKKEENNKQKPVETKTKRGRPRKTKI